MPPKAKAQAKFPLTHAQAQAVEELLPTLRALHDDWQPYIQKLKPFMKDKPAVAFVDRMCFEYDMPIKRTIIGRLEYLMGSIIQSNTPPEQVIKHCMSILGNKVLNLSEEFSTQFRESAAQMLQLRETWQGSEDEQSSVEDNDENNENDDASVYECGHCQRCTCPPGRPLRQMWL